VSALDSARLNESARVGVAVAAHEPITWHCHTTLRKFRGDSIDVADLLDVVEIDGNMLMLGGASALWDFLVGSTAAGQPFNNANAFIGVGDSSTAEANTQTDLVATTNKVRKAMDATFPTHTDGTTGTANQAVFQSTFGTADANFVWAEWGIFNAATAGRMLNRKVSALGTKTSAATWTLALTLSLN
jgi:hypothetical protein